MEKKLFLLEGMIVLFRMAGIMLGFMLMLMGFLGLGVGLREQTTLWIFALFCLSALATVSISAWRLLDAAHRLIEEITISKRRVFQILPLLSRCSTCCVVIAGAWLVLMVGFLILNEVLLPSACTLCGVIALCTLLLALGFHLPAAALRRTLPLMGREQLPFAAGRSLLGVVALAVGVVLALAGRQLSPTTLEWVLLADVWTCCLLLALFALCMHPRLLRLCGWGLILLGGLTILNCGSAIVTGGWMLPLILLATACIPAAIGLWLTVLTDLIS